MYGSYSKGYPKPESDIDVAVVVPKVEGDWLTVSTDLWLDVDKVNILIEPVLLEEGHHSPLYDDEVAAILQMQGEPAKKKRDIHFEVGESVKITEGAFNGMVGKISDIQEDKEKLYLTIDMCGHATTAELDYDQVDKIDD